MSALATAVLAMNVARFGEYWAMVVQSAAGAEIDPEHAMEVCDAVGKSAEDFDADVAEQETRLEYAASIAPEPAVTAQLASLESEIAADNAAETERRKVWQAAQNVKASRCGDLIRRSDGMVQPKIWLRANPRPDVAQKEAKIAEQRKQNHQAITAADAALRDNDASRRRVENAIEADEQQIETNGATTIRKANLANDTASLAKNVEARKPLEARRAELQREHDAIEQRVADLDRQKLTGN